MLLNRASLSLRLSTTCHSLLVSLFQQVLSVQLCPVGEVMNHAGYQQHCTFWNPLPAYQLLVLSLSSWRQSRTVTTFPWSVSSTTCVQSSQLETKVRNFAHRRHGWLLVAFRLTRGITAHPSLLGDNPSGSVARRGHWFLRRSLWTTRRRHSLSSSQIPPRHGPPPKSPPRKLTPTWCSDEERPGLRQVISSKS